MNIPPKYEDLVAQLSAALDRESVLVARSNQNKLMMDSAYGEIATLQEELDEFELVQQRLTVSEQLLREVQKAARKQDWASGYPEIFSRVDAALKPAAEGEGS